MHPGQTAAPQREGIAASAAEDSSGQALHVAPLPRDDKSFQDPDGRGQVGGGHRGEHGLGRGEGVLGAVQAEQGADPSEEQRHRRIALRPQGPARRTFRALTGQRGPGKGAHRRGGGRGVRRGREHAVGQLQGGLVAVGVLEQVEQVCAVQVSQPGLDLLADHGLRLGLAAELQQGPGLDLATPQIVRAEFQRPPRVLECSFVFAVSEVQLGQGALDLVLEPPPEVGGDGHAGQQVLQRGAIVPLLEVRGAAEPQGHRVLGVTVQDALGHAGHRLPVLGAEGLDGQLDGVGASRRQQLVEGRAGLVLQPGGVERARPHPAQRGEVGVEPGSGGREAGQLGIVRLACEQAGGQVGCCCRATGLDELVQQVVELRCRAQRRRVQAFGDRALGLVGFLQRKQGPRPDLAGQLYGAGLLIRDAEHLVSERQGPIRPSQILLVLPQAHEDGRTDVGDGLVRRLQHDEQVRPRRVGVSQTLVGQGAHAPHVVEVGAPLQQPVRLPQQRHPVLGLDHLVDRPLRRREIWIGQRVEHVVDHAAGLLTAADGVQRLGPRGDHGHQGGAVPRDRGGVPPLLADPLAQRGAGDPRR